LAADAGEDTELEEQQQIDVDGCLIAREVGVATGACRIALHVKDDVFFVFGAAGAFGMRSRPAELPERAANIRMNERA
jgi:hypothetical protein